MTIGWGFLIFIVILIAFVILEGKRQERKYGKTSGSPNLMGAGLLDLQKHLQADWKVDTLQQQYKNDDTQLAEDDESGEP